MNDLVVLAMMVLIFVALIRVTEWVFPSWVLRFGKGTIRKLQRTLWDHVWRQPVRRWGMGMTFLMWCVVSAIIATLGILVTGNVGLMCLAGILWATSGALWWLLRTLARRRFRARQMPGRRRGA